MIKDCTTCDNFDIETVYGVCCKYGVLSNVKEDINKNNIVKNIITKKNTKNT